MRQRQTSSTLISVGVDQCRLSPQWSRFSFVFHNVFHGQRSSVELLDSVESALPAVKWPPALSRSAGQFDLAYTEHTRAFSFGVHSLIGSVLPVIGLNSWNRYPRDIQLYSLPFLSKIGCHSESSIRHLRASLIMTARSRRWVIGTSKSFVTTRVRPQD